MINPMHVVIGATVVGAVVVHFSMKHFKSDVMRLRIIAMILMGIFAIGIGLRLYAMWTADSEFLPAIKEFADKYPNVLTADMAKVTGVVEASAFMQGVGVGLAAGASIGALGIEWFLRRKMKEYQQKLAEARLRAMKARGDARVSSPRG